jgi:hypothetical protein
LALAGFAAGAVFGAVIQNILSDDVRVLETAVGVLCLAVLGATAVVGEMSNSAESASQELKATLEAFSKHISLQVRGQMVRDTNKYHSPDQDLVVRAFRNAKSEILVLDQLTDEGVRPDIDLNSAVMKWHLDTIIERAKAGVSYKRYCQVSDPSRPFHQLRQRAAVRNDGEHVFANHCIAMCDMRSATGNVVLKVAPNIYPYKFVIIDQAVLVLQLHEVDQADPDLDEPRTLCELVIDDPERQLIEYFYSMWQKVDDHPKTHAITAGGPDLEVLKQSRVAGDTSGQHP